MSKEYEYQKLATEIGKLQDYSIKVMLYSIAVVGGIVGLREDISETTIIGAGFVLAASLLYLIGAARKIFILSAFLAVEHDDAPGFNWHAILPKIQTRIRGWFETQVIAAVYFMVTVGCLVIFLPVSSYYSVVTFICHLTLSAALFTVPLRANRYRELMEELRAQHHDRSSKAA